MHAGANGIYWVISAYHKLYFCNSSAITKIDCELTEGRLPSSFSILPLCTSAGRWLRWWEARSLFTWQYKRAKVKNKLPARGYVFFPWNIRDSRTELPDFTNVICVLLFMPCKHPIQVINIKLYINPSGTISFIIILFTLLIVLATKQVYRNPDVDFDP